MLQQQSTKIQAPGPQIPSTLCFATVSTNRHVPVFEEFNHGRAVVREIMRQHNAGCVDSFAFVVMPDQLHWLFALGSASSVESVLSTLKQQTALAIDNGLAQDLWEPGYLQHEADQGQDLLELARFIINNPVRDGLARDIGDYSLWDSAWTGAYTNPE